MDSILIAFITLHCISLLCSLLTYKILSVPPIVSTSHSIKLVGRPPIREEASPTPRSNHRLLRLACILCASLSAFILIPGFASGWNMNVLPDSLCWSQGLVINYLYLTIHICAFCICLQTWRLIVKWDFDFEHRRGKIMLYAIYLIPLIIVIAACIASYAYTHGTLIYMEGKKHVVAGIKPLSGYCFWGFPIWIRFIAFHFWYILFAIPGTILSIWVAISLIIMRKTQLNNLRDLNAGTMQPISIPILYRTSFFALMYTILCMASFTPGLVNYINYFMGSNYFGHDYIGPAQFAGACCGIAFLCIFGTGNHSVQVLKRWWWK